MEEQIINLFRSSFLVRAVALIALPVIIWGLARVVLSDNGEYSSSDDGGYSSTTDYDLAVYLDDSSEAVVASLEHALRDVPGVKEVVERSPQDAHEEAIALSDQAKEVPPGAFPSTLFIIVDDAFPLDETRAKIAALENVAGVAAR